MIRCAALVNNQFFTEKQLTAEAIQAFCTEVEQHKNARASKKDETDAAI